MNYCAAVVWENAGGGWVEGRGKAMPSVQPLLHELRRKRARQKKKEKKKEGSQEQKTVDMKEAREQETSV